MLFPSISRRRYKKATGGGSPTADLRVDVSANQRIDVSSNNRILTTSASASKEINDLSAASSITTSMQIEVDTGGTTSEKVTIPQIKSYRSGLAPRLRIPLVSTLPASSYSFTTSYGFIGGSPSLAVVSVDLANYTQVRVIHTCSTNESAQQPSLTVVYNTSYSGTYSNYSDIASPALTLTFNDLDDNVVKSDWTNMVSGAKVNDVYVALGGKKSADGTFDLRQTALEFR